MKVILEFNSWLSSNIIWGIPMLVLLLGTGIVLGFKTNFIVLTKFGYIMKNTLFKMFKKSEGGEGEVTPFQAVSTALAATVGTGNIAGVALAIAIGGPGALFWMWLSAIIGMSTKFAEVVLAIVYRKSDDKGSFSGGPMYYIARGLGMKKLATAFAIFGALATFGIGCMVQSNSITAALNHSFGLDPKICGIVLAVAVGLVILGGIKRIGAVTEKLVPLMAAFYILGALIIIILNIKSLPGALGLIFSSAFTGHAAAGGFTGSTLLIALRLGVSRGVFTNEAGLGSAPIAHAAATTDHPVRQGLWGVFEVFVDTLIICTITGLVIIVTGEWQSGLQGAALSSAAFETGFRGGKYIVSIGLTLFAFSTLLGWSYYGEKCAEYILGRGSSIFYRLAFIVFVFVGAIGGLEIVWDISDTFNGLMAIPNLISVLLLSGVVVTMVKDFFNDPERVRKSPSEYLDLIDDKYKPRD